MANEDSSHKKPTKKPLKKGFSLLGWDWVWNFAHWEPDVKKAMAPKRSPKDDDVGDRFNGLSPYLELNPIE